MEEILFKNKYRIKSARREGYNYSSAGFYYITICSKNKEYIFGDIINEKMILSEYGGIIEKYWKEIPCHFNNVKLDKYIVMPNHIHGIIQIMNDDIDCADVRVRRDVALLRLYECEKQNNYNDKQNISKDNKMSEISPKPKSISTIIRSFKSITTKTINNKLNSNNTIWQSRFYDRVIRNDAELNRIRQYVINNPIKWEMDRNNINKK